jgi:hypothetical protein
MFLHAVWNTLLVCIYKTLLKQEGAFTWKNNINNNKKLIVLSVTVVVVVVVDDRTYQMPCWK